MTLYVMHLTRLLAHYAMLLTSLLLCQMPHGVLLKWPLDVQSSYAQWPQDDHRGPTSSHFNPARVVGAQQLGGYLGAAIPGTFPPASSRK